MLGGRTCEPSGHHAPTCFVPVWFATPGGVLVHRKNVLNRLKKRVHARDCWGFAKKNAANNATGSHDVSTSTQTQCGGYAAVEGCLVNLRMEEASPSFTEGVRPDHKQGEVLLGRGTETCNETNGKQVFCFLLQSGGQVSKVVFDKKWIPHFEVVSAMVSDVLSASEDAGSAELVVPLDNIEVCVMEKIAEFCRVVETDAQNAVKTKLQQKTEACSEHEAANRLTHCSKSNPKKSSGKPALFDKTLLCASFPHGEAVVPPVPKPEQPGELCQPPPAREALEKQKRLEISEWPAASLFYVPEQTEKFFEAMDTKLICDLVMAANFLGFELLLQLGLNHLRNQFILRSPLGLCRYFNLPESTPTTPQFSEAALESVKCLVCKSVELCERRFL